MNSSTETPMSMKLKVGVFVVLGLALVGYMTVLVNDKPFWWKGCSPIHRVHVADATGLKTKSAIRSLGLQIGYLKAITLVGKQVELQICLTAPVEITSETRAYIRGEGFLGDKFVELRPVKYLYSEDAASEEEVSPIQEKPESKEKKIEKKKTESFPEGQIKPTQGAWNFSLFPSAYAADEPPAPERPAPAAKPTKKGNIPVGEGGQSMDDVVKQVDKLVTEMTGLTQNLKEALDPDTLKETVKQLNKTLENASKTLSPEGGLNTTAQRTLRKLEDAIEQLRDMMTRVNRGEGSVGRIINDPVFAQQIEEALRNLNKLLNRVGDVIFRISVGVDSLPAYDGTRGYFQLAIWPKFDRYYLLGLSVDPRGKKTKTTTVVKDPQANTITTTEKTETEESGLLLTGMLGKVLADRLDLSIGILHGDGTGSAALYLGPRERERKIELRADVYSRGSSGGGVDTRITGTLRPWWTLNLRGGLEGVKQVNQKVNYFVGAGITFDDDDIKLLFAFL